MSADQIDEYDKAKKWLGVSAQDVVRAQSVEPWRPVILERYFEDAHARELIREVMVGLYRLRVRTTAQQKRIERKRRETRS